MITSAVNKMRRYNLLLIVVLIHEISAQFEDRESKRMSNGNKNAEQQREEAGKLESEQGEVSRKFLKTAQRKEDPEELPFSFGKYILNLFISFL